MSPAFMRALLIIAGYIAAYVVLDWVSYIYPIGPFDLTPWNPPPGLSIALLLIHGLRFAPALFAAGLVAEFVVRDAPPNLPVTTLAIASVAFCYAATAALLRRLAIDPELKNLRDVSRFVAVALAAPALAALAYLGTHALAGQVAWLDAQHSALQFWVGDAIGILVTTPVVIHLHGALRRPPERGHGLELFAQAAAILAALALVFGVRGLDAPKYFYMLFLPLIWISVRHGTRGAVFALLAIQIGIIAAVRIAGFGSATVLEFQLLLSAMAVTGLILGAVVSDREHAQHALAEREAELARSLRLAAAAETSSSLAHELNQPLAAISNYVQVCAVLLDQPELNRQRLRETIRATATEVTRAGDIVRHLREFFRSGTSRLEHTRVVDLFDVCTQRVAERLAEEQISLHREIAPHLPPVLVDRLQIETVLNNLLSNSIDALAGGDRRDRRIDLRAERHGSAIGVSVSDTGPGLPEELTDGNFRPFFTTKAEGMGLGLAISRSIVENHGGRLVARRLAHGTMFSFTLALEPPHEGPP